MTCTDPQCLYSTAIPLLPLWAVQPVQSLSACTVQLYLYSPYGPYGLYKGALYLLLYHGVILPLNGTMANHPRTVYTSNSLTLLPRLWYIWHYPWQEFVREGGQIRKMGAEGRMYGKEERCMRGFGGET